METTLVCLNSLLSIKATLESLSNCVQESDVNTNDSIVQLRCAHNQLVQSLVQLRKCHAQSTNFNSDNIDVGSLVLAPRYFHGTICHDLAIVVKIETLDEQQDIESEVQVISDTKVIWLRPTSAYEMNSPGIKFSKSQLISNGLEYFDMQNEYLKNIRTNNDIFVKSDQELWCEGLTQRIDDSKNEVCVLLKPNVTQTATLDLLNVAPFPRSYLQLQKSKKCKDNLNVDDTESLNHYVDKSSLLRCSDVPIKIGFDDMCGFGGWEVHTTRCGSRMLGELQLQ